MEYVWTDVQLYDYDGHPYLVPVCGMIEEADPSVGLSAGVVEFVIEQEDGTEIDGGELNNSDREACEVALMNQYREGGA